jgi:hypothetical protein
LGKCTSATRKVEQFATYALGNKKRNQESKRSLSDQISEFNYMAMAMAMERLNLPLTRQHLHTWTIYATQRIRCVSLVTIVQKLLQSGLKSRREFELHALVMQPILGSGN